MENKLYRVEINPLNIGPILSTPTNLNPTRVLPLREPSIQYILSNLVHASITQDAPLFKICNEAVSYNPLIANLLPGIWEVLMEQARPVDVKRKRTECAFFFTNIEDACHYQTSYPGMQKGKLCEVSIIEQEFMMECDMAWLNNVDEKTIKAAEAINQFEHYWAGEKTNNPIMEVLFAGKYQLKSIKNERRND